MSAMGPAIYGEEPSLKDFPPDDWQVVALHEGRWVVAKWTGSHWLSQGKPITGVTRWLPCARPWNQKLPKRAA